eukprot:TRINITY_DN55256_c0_g1_i1.p1 TRINITY_DN55256_c0_g1~~TRINITY_DN55256_c0_g1_i1.p1  ORF type:complete len:463 (-),score=69.12 TRINITY_DN55256_c0_g1_i1:54-1442(-)
MVVRRSPGDDGPQLSKTDFAAAVVRIDEQLERARANAEKLDKRSREYTDLKGVLADLPEKVQHPIMVPYGPLAFFEGHLEHTNEVLTQLSSEWFAMRTVKHALGLVDRRQTRLREDQATVERELQELDMRRRIAAGAGGEAHKQDVEGIRGACVSVDEDGFLDIREPYIEDGSGDGFLSKADVSIAEDSPCGGVVASKASATLQELERWEERCREPTPKVVAMSQGGANNTADPLARLRELERQEEMEELDDLVERYEHGMGSETRETELSAKGLCSDNGVQAGQVNSPADIFRLMKCVDEASAGGYRSVANASLAGADSHSLLSEGRLAGSPASQQPCVNGEDGPISAPATFDGDASIGREAFTGSIRESAGATPSGPPTAFAPSSFSGHGASQSDGQPPASSRSAGGRLPPARQSDMRGGSSGACIAGPTVGATAGGGCKGGDDVPKRVSKFKSERMGRG